MTISKLDWIKSQLIAGETAGQTATRLNTPVDTPNPVPPAQVPE